MITRDHHFGFWAATLVAFIVILAAFREILLPFVAGIGIAYFLNPLADWLEARGLRRTIGATLIIGLGGVVIAGLLVFLAPLIFAQVKQLALAVPDSADRSRRLLETMARERLGEHFPSFQAALARGLADLQANLGSFLTQALGVLWTRGTALISLVSVLLITPLVAFYMLVDWHQMLARVETWLPRPHAATIQRLAQDIDRAVAAFVRGQGTICLVLGVFYALGLTAIGLNYGLLIGLMTGLMAFVPVVGWVVGLLTALGLGIAQFGFDPVKLLMIAAVLAGGMALDTAFLSPRLVGEKVGLHPVWLIFSLFAFSYLFGFVGTLVAVPLAAAAVVLVRHALSLYMASDVYRGVSGGDPA